MIYLNKEEKVKKEEGHEFERKLERHKGIWKNN